MSRRTLIRGGRVITAESDFTGDVMIEGETIRAVGESVNVAADEVIDARDRYVLPGCVDVHTHLDVAFQGVTACDDFKTGTVAAAYGGTTTIVDFAEQPEHGSLREGLDEWHTKLERAGPVVDVGFHIIIRQVSPAVEQEIRELSRDGVTTVKLHFAYPGLFMLKDEEIFRCMRVAGESAALAMVHAENGDVIEVLIDEARARGDKDPIWHARTRPPLTEIESVQRAIYLAQMAECPLYVVHVSCGRAAELIARARESGQRVWGEACVHHLFADEEDLTRPGLEGAKFIFTPPPRTAADREQLWKSLADGELAAVSTDHFPNRFSDRRAAATGGFSAIPNGTGGIEERLMLMHHHGVRQGRFSLNRLVQLLATNPARLLGLYPRKGSIAVGADADIVIFDPERQFTITADAMHSQSDYTIYEGYSVKGIPETVLVRGETVIDDGELRVDPGYGQFIARAGFGQSLQSQAPVRA